MRAELTLEPAKASGTRMLSAKVTSPTQPVSRDQRGGPVAGESIGSITGMAPWKPEHRNWGKPQQKRHSKVFPKERLQNGVVAGKWRPRHEQWLLTRDAWAVLLDFRHWLPKRA